MSLSRGQQKVYRPLVKEAYHAHCMAIKDMPDKDAWYRKELLRSPLEISSTTEIPGHCKHGKAFGDPDMFRVLMLHFAKLANNTYWLTRLATEQERRMKHLISQRLIAIAREDPSAHANWAYARVICHQMNLPLEMDDCPVEYLWKVFQALDTQVRRLKRNHGRTQRRINEPERKTLQAAKTKPAHMVFDFDAVA